MNKINILYIPIILMISFSGFSQKPVHQKPVQQKPVSQKPISQNNVVLEKDDSKELKAINNQVEFNVNSAQLQLAPVEKDTLNAKSFVKKVNNQIEKYIKSGQIEEANEYIQKNRKLCSSTDDRNWCEGGLDYTNGYVYQQAAISDPKNRKEYQRKAENYYEKVLEVFPENKAAWKNLSQLRGERGTNETTIGMLEQMAIKFPAERVNYYVQIGDMYRNENNSRKACEYYSRAHKEDPFSEKACSAIVSLYTKDNYSCTLSSNIRELALDCQEIGFPNYSEELLRKEITRALSKSQFEKAEESLILWAYILAENNWLDPIRVLRLNKKLFPKGNIIKSEEKQIRTALNELQRVLEADNYQDIGRLNYWDNYSPEIDVAGDWVNLRPLSTLMKIYHSKGQDAYFKGNLKNTEAFWQKALNETISFDKAYFTVIATDMAQFYNNNPKYDPDNSKLDDLVVDLFNMKGAAYRDNDKKMIRKYHITLGGIYYDKEKWGGFGATNAKFQLKRALSTRFGKIVHPELRKMLGDVYMKLDEKNNALKSYSLAIQDHLSLDHVTDADKLSTSINKRYGQQMNRETKVKFNEIKKVIDWRKQLASKENELIKNETGMYEYLAKVSIAENQSKSVLSEEFVQVQFFKGLTDLGANLPKDKPKEKQNVYASALENINGVDELSSPADYKRIQNIKTSLEESIDQPQQLEVTKMNKKTVLTYDNSLSKEGFKTYNIQSLGKEIIVPNQLFELNGVLQKHYKENETSKVARFQVKNGNFEVLRQG